MNTPCNKRKRQPDGLPECPDSPASPAQPSTNVIMTNTSKNVTSHDPSWVMPDEDYEYTPFGNVNYGDVKALFNTFVCASEFQQRARDLENPFGTRASSGGARNTKGKGEGKKAMPRK